MPLQQGKSKKAFNFNVEELIHSYKKTGKIGSSSPKSLLKARKQALAIAFDKKRG
jgi:hypothetical protein